MTAFPPEVSWSAVFRLASGKFPYESTVEVSDGGSKPNPGIAWSKYAHQESEWLVHCYGSRIHPSGDDGDIEPGVAGLAVTILVGWLLIFGGVAHLIAAFSGGGAAHVLWQVLIGVLYLFGGIYFLMHPLLALGSLTLFLAAIILMEGVFEVIAYFRMRGHRASGWLLLNALITLFLGGLIWFHWPSSSVWAIGILVGVNLLMTGISRLMFGLAARELAHRAA
jgi:uncharacterized membrane protein HdeD (DUF308 family)